MQCTLSLYISRKNQPAAYLSYVGNYVWCKFGSEVGGLIWLGKPRYLVVPLLLPTLQQSLLKF